jgi:hypothetical protein
LRQPFGATSGSTGKGTRSVSAPAVAHVLGDALVAGEQLVAAVAAQHDLDVRSVARARYHVGNDDGVGERLVERRHDLARSRRGSSSARRCARWASPSARRSRRVVAFVEREPRERRGERAQLR